jgi:hypothetical protein
MHLSWNEIKVRAARFAEEWKDAHYERGESQTFYGKSEGIDEKYLSQHRSPWYSQEERQPPLFLCTYINRKSKTNGKTFRFILNHSKAIAANVYLLLYPKKPVADAIKSNPELIKLFVADA